MVDAYCLETEIKASFGSPSETHLLSGVNLSEKIKENQKKRHFFEKFSFDLD